MSIKISDSGYIYEGNGKRTQLRGHISQLLKEQNTIGRKIRKWWKTYLKSV